MPIMIFDKDGVILDQMEATLEGFADILEPYGIPRQETKDYIFARRGDSPNNQISDILRTYGKKAPVDQLLETLWKILEEKEPKPFIDALDCIPRFYRNGHKLVMSTGYRSDIASRQMERVRLREYFDLILGNDDETMKKGDIHVLIVKDEYKLSDEDLKNVMIVGDGAFEIRLGKKFGLKTFGIARNNEEEELKAVGADEVFPNLYELAEYLNI